MKLDFVTDHIDPQSRFTRFNARDQTPQGGVAFCDPQHSSEAPRPRPRGTTRHDKPVARAAEAAKHDAIVAGEADHWLCL
jgi:hypothetical protein